MNHPTASIPAGSRRGWGLLIFVLLAECLGAAALVWISAQGALSADNQPWSDVFGLLVMAVFAWGYTVLCLAGAFARRGWARAASMVLQILTFAVATAMFQGILGTVWLAWVLVALCVLGAAGVITARAADQTSRAELDAE